MYRTGLMNSWVVELTRNNPDIIYGKIKPTITPKGLRHYPADYNPILEYWEQIQKKQTVVPKKIRSNYKKISKFVNYC